MKIVEGKSEAVVLKALKDKNVDMVVSVEKYCGKDFMKSRNSGLNQVLCRLAVKNKVVIGFNFDDVLDAKNRGLILGKMMQNIMLCRRYKVGMYVFSRKRNNSKDLQAFARVIGMTPLESKNAVKFVKKVHDIGFLD